jgi:hypothetical protein
MNNYNKINIINQQKLNKKIYSDTLEYIDELSLTTKLSKTIKLKIKSQDIIFNYNKNFNKTIIKVVNQDMIKSIIDLHNTFYNKQKKILWFLTLHQEHILVEE